MRRQSCRKTHTSNNRLSQLTLQPCFRHQVLEAVVGHPLCSWKLHSALVHKEVISRVQDSSSPASIDRTLWAPKVILAMEALFNSRPKFSKEVISCKSLAVQLGKHSNSNTRRKVDQMLALDQVCHSWAELHRIRLIGSRNCHHAYLKHR